MCVRTGQLLVFVLSILLFLADPVRAADPGQGRIEGEESTVFDLYLSDIFKGSILARYTDDWFEIDNPNDIIDQISEIKAANELLPLLEGRIEKARTLDGVGSVRFDLNTFRIILILDPKLLPTKVLNLDNRIPDPEQKFSLSQSFRGASSGDTDEKFQSALNHRTLASLGKYVARVDGTAVQSQPYVLTEASAGGIFGPFEVSSGYIQTPGQSFASSVEVAGFKLQTSDQIFANQDSIRGGRFQIFVPSRSRVEFFRDGRLLSVQLLDFGLQDVDTRSFPDGSYNVDVVIIEDNGNTTSETRFYTKSGYLTIGTEPIYSLAFGAGRDRLDIFSLPVYQAGVRYRALDELELNGSAYGTDSVSVLEMGALTVYQDFYFSAAYSVSTEGKMGVSGTLTGNIFGLTLALSGSQTLNPETKVDDFVPQLDRHDEELIRSRIDDLSRERTTASANIFYQFDKFQVGVSATGNRRAIDPFFNSLNPLTEIPDQDRYAYGPRIVYRIIDDPYKSLRLETFYFRTDEGDNLALRIGFRYRFGSQWNAQEEIRAERVDSKDRDTALTTVGYDNRTQQGRGARVILSNELRHDEQSGRGNQVSNQAAINYTNNYIRTDSFARDNRSSQQDQTNLGIDAEAAFLVSNEGNVSISRPIPEGAAIIADLRSTSTDAKFTLLVNGQRYDALHAGQQTVVGLPPFRTYKVQIRPEEDTDMVNYDQTIHEVTLFPGNIVRKSWTVEKILIVIGRLVDVSGNIIPLQRIKGTKDYVVTEEDGTFQADLTGKEELSVDSKKYQCRIEIVMPTERKNPFIVELADVVCR